MKKNLNVAGTLNVIIAEQLNVLTSPPSQYVLLCLYSSEPERQKSLYIGYTSDLRKRVDKHNNGESLATRPFRSYRLIFYEAFLNRIDAKNRREYLKSGYGRKTIKETMNKYFLENI